MEKQMALVRVRALVEIPGMAGKGGVWRTDSKVAKKLIDEGKAEKAPASKKKKAKKKSETRETRKK
jgi:hypothetical protein